MKMKQVCCMVIALFLLAMLSPGTQAYEQNTPMRIDCNDDFGEYAGSGNGTEANPWMIEDLDIDGTGYGFCIYVGNTTDYFIVRNCYLHDASGRQNTMYYEDSGLILCNVTNGLVEDSVMIGNGIGINLWSGCHENIFSYNTADSNLNCGVYLHDNCGGNVFEDNIASSNGFSGMYLFDNCDENTISHNNVDSNDLYGIYLWDDCDYNDITYNLIRTNAYEGIILSYANHNTVQCNGITENHEIGVFLDEAYNNIICGNNISCNDCTGLSIDRSDSNRIDNNTIESNGDCGLYIYDSMGNRIDNNTLGLNYPYGIYITESDLQSCDNELYHNNLVNNAMQAYDGAGGNSWDDGYPSGGNHWSDYNGTDQYSGPRQNLFGFDGIGDTPYCGIGLWGMDRYPLIEPVGTYGLGIRDEPSSGLGIRDEPS